MKIKILSFALFFCAFQFSSASRILFLFPSPSQSHLIVVKGLSTTLAERGHDVTVVSPFPLEKPMKNYRDVKVEVPASFKAMQEDMLKNPNGPMWKRFPMLLDSLVTMANTMLNSTEFKKIMAEEKFDLVVIGMFFNNYLLGVGDHFKCPTMMLSVSGAMTVTNLLMGNPLGVSSVRHMFMNNDVKTFKDRVVNFVIHGSDYLLKAYMNYLMQTNYE